MRKNTAYTAFFLNAVFFRYLIIPRTVKMIQWAKAKKTVDVRIAFVAGIIFTFLIGKKSAVVFSDHLINSPDINLPGK